MANDKRRSDYGQVPDGTDYWVVMLYSIFLLGVVGVAIATGYAISNHEHLENQNEKINDLLFAVNQLTMSMEEQMDFNEELRVNVSHIMVEFSLPPMLARNVKANGKMARTLAEGVAVSIRRISDIEAIIHEMEMDISASIASAKSESESESEKSKKKKAKAKRSEDEGKEDGEEWASMNAESHDVDE